MKKVLILMGIIISSSFAFAGGIITNTNQGTAWVRTLNRAASTEIDAVFFNPAGLTKLSDGLHLSISNQIITQDMTIENSLLGKTYKGEVFAPVFPDFFAAYKTGKMVFSLGFTPVGGGGSASYKEGVPMIELPVFGVSKQLAQAGVTGYSMDANFEGSSVYFGIQAGVSYELSDIVSVYAGARYVWMKNSYNGEMKNIMFSTAGGNFPANIFMNGVATKALAGAGKATTAASGMQGLIDANLGNLTFAQAVGAGAIDANTRAQLEGGLIALGLTQDQINKMNIATAQATYQGAATQLTKQAGELQAGAKLLSDQEAEVEQSGSGITPILGVNISLLEERLNFGIKYEFHTNLELTNTTPAGKGFKVGFTPEGKPIEMFPDGKKTDADMPALLTLGAAYKVTDDFKAQINYNLYFDKYLGWAEEKQGDHIVNIIDKNMWEVGLGLEYNITDALLISAGYLRGETRVAKSYHNDMRFSLVSDTYGFGGSYKINDIIQLQLGGFYVKYHDRPVEYTKPPLPTYNQTYGKGNLAFSIGVNLSFGNL